MRQLLAVLLLALPSLCGCFGLSSEEETRLNNYKYNAKLYYEKGDLARSEQQCRRGLELDPKDPSLNLNLALALLKQGGKQQDIPKVEEAQKRFKMIVDEGYTSGEVPKYKAYFGLGLSELTLARLTPDDQKALSDQWAEMADEHLRRAVELDPENIEGPLNLAQLRLLQGRLAESLPYLDQGLDQLAKSRDLRERELSSKGAKSAEAATRIRNQIDQNVKMEVTYRQTKGRVLFLLGRLDESLKELSRVDELGGMTALEYYNRGRVHEALGHREQAVADYEQFLKTSSLGVGDTNVRDALRRISTLKVADGGQARSGVNSRP